MNGPEIVIQTALFSLDYNYRVAYVLIAFPLSIVYIYWNWSPFLVTLTVANRRYGRCYAKIIIPLYTFLEFYTHLEANSARSLQIQVLKGPEYYASKNIVFLMNVVIFQPIEPRSLRLLESCFQMTRTMMNLTCDQASLYFPLRKK